MTENPPAERGGAAHRFTLRVPSADTSLVQWWNAQDEPSASVRSLIRDEIMRHGFTDTVNRPVTQQPRRGRPPLSGEDEAGSHEEQSGPIKRAPVAAVVTEPQPPVRASAEVDNGDSELSLDADAADTPTAPVQVDMEKMFGHKSN
jgi:hypothetical protein